VGLRKREKREIGRGRKTEINFSLFVLEDIRENPSLDIVYKLAAITY
jgi:hypothetical protein